MKQLSFGFSPCPNDTFMIDAMLHEKLEASNYSFEPVIEDVEELNERALRGELDLTKLSYHAFMHVTDKYQMLPAGSALGFGVGPLLIAKKHLSENEIEQARIALPGKWTTANWLFSLRYPAAENKVDMLFSEIEGAVASGAVDAGVIIHENRFTYAERGFTRIIDLGTYWEDQTKLPIPLGGIAIRKSLSLETKKDIARVLKSSIQYAFDHPGTGSDFIRAHAQEMAPDVLKKHIELYVNAFSLDLGGLGRKAVRKMFELSVQQGLIENQSADYLL